MVIVGMSAASIWLLIRVRGIENSSNVAYPQGV